MLYCQTSPLIALRECQAKFCVMEEGDSNHHCYYLVLLNNNYDYTRMFYCRPPSHVECKKHDNYSKTRGRLSGLT